MTPSQEVLEGGVLVASMAMISGTTWEQTAFGQQRSSNSIALQTSPTPQAKFSQGSGHCAFRFEVVSLYNVLH